MVKFLANYRNRCFLPFDFLISIEKSKKNPECIGKKITDLLTFK